MAHWLRPVLVTLCVLGIFTLACAQAPADAQRTQQEKEADALFLNGEACMKTLSYEEAISTFTNLMKRYPDTDTRYKGQFRMADALMALKQEPKAFELLQSVVKEENPDWSPKALAKIGDLYKGQQKFADAFRAYKQIYLDYPDSPMVDYAHFSIGKAHFDLGHYELAAAELDKVGTAAASQMPDLQRVSPGEPLYVRMWEPNLVAATDSKLVVAVSAKSGDKESVTLYPEVEGGDRFTAALPTVLGAPKAGDGTLQLVGNDTVTLTYKSRYVGTGAVDRSITMATASNARLLLRDPQGNEVRGVVLSDTLVVEVNDADRDVTDKADTIPIEIKTRKKDNEKLTLTETGPHTGVFRASIVTIGGDPKPDSGSIESSAELAEGSATQLDDLISVYYIDEINLSTKDGGPRKLPPATATIFQPTNGTTTPVGTTITDSSTAIKALLYKGRSLSQIGATYKDLGQATKSTQSFKKAAEQFQAVIAQFPNAPEVEDALYGQYQNYVAMENYNGAIQVISRITTQFPQSTRAPQALMELASLHVKREEYDKALAIYQNLSQSARGTTLAEDAAYQVCITYMEMLKPKLGSLSVVTKGIQVTPEQVTVALEEFARNYPNSERTPEAMWNLVRFRNENEDYRGAVDTARRMEALFPDSVMTGRVLLLMAQAQVKLRDFDGAVTTLKRIIANYASEAEAAGALLKQLEKRMGGSTRTTGTTGTTGAAATTTGK
jgi:TolA-binding protein